MVRYDKARIEAATEIVHSIDHWLKVFTDPQVSQRVGELIQRTAMRELAFMDYLSEDWIPMDKLRVMANDQLEAFGEPRIPKPPYAPVANRFGDGPMISPALRDLALKKQEEIYRSMLQNLNIMPHSMILFAPKKTRREVLESMSAKDLIDAFQSAEAKEKRKYRINYILEAERSERESGGSS